MAYEEILYDVSDSIATVTLNRPAKLNAWTPVMDRELSEALLGAERDDQVRAIIITGAGKGFCAGADMSRLDGLAQSGPAAGNHNRVVSEHRSVQRPAGTRVDFTLPHTYPLSINKPVLAAINGAAAGLGFVMSLYCDLRFASESAKFTTAFAKRGLIAEHGISWMLPRLVGISNALDLLFSARLIDAQEALRMGLVSRVFAPDDLLPEVRKYALDLAKNVSPRSIGVMKKQVYDALFLSLSEAMHIADEEMVKSFASTDFKEGVAHFIEKRAAAFTGK